MKEQEIISLLKCANHAAFELIYYKYVTQVANFCLLYVSDDYVEEIVQEVFIKLWLNRATLSTHKSIQGYLFIITRNLIFDKFRANKSDFYRLSLISALEEASDENIEEEIQASELAEYIDDLINQLPPRCKEIFTLSRKEHLSNKEIAQKLGISVKSVEASITRALKFLKEYLYLFLLFF